MPPTTSAMPCLETSAAAGSRGFSGRVFGGLPSISPSFPATASWRDVATSLPDQSAPGIPLSPAERVVLAQLRQGFSNREIAQVLGKSEATVKNQVAACLQKFGVANRGRLIALLR